MEKHYRSKSVMLATLAKVQPLQAEILKTGRSCHLDAGVYQNLMWERDETHLNFELTVFEDHDIVKEFDFYSDMTEKELQAEFGCLEAYVERIKEEA